MSGGKVVTGVAIATFASHHHQPGGVRGGEREGTVVSFAETHTSYCRKLECCIHLGYCGRSNRQWFFRQAGSEEVDCLVVLVQHPCGATQKHLFITSKNECCSFQRWRTMATRTAFYTKTNLPGLSIPIQISSRSAKLKSTTD